MFRLSVLRDRVALMPALLAVQAIGKAPPRPRSASVADVCPAWSRKHAAAPLGHEAGNGVGRVLLDIVETLAAIGDLQGGDVLAAPANQGLVDGDAWLEGEKQLWHLRARF